jgi:hypothetical protein
MNDYFRLVGKSPKEVASAFASDETKMPWELIDEVSEVNELPLDFYLIRLYEENDRLGKSIDLSPLTEVWLDYQPNSLAWPFFSIRLKSIISEYLTGDEGVDWVTIRVKGPDKEEMYYLPRFNSPLDVLDTEATVYLPKTNRIIKPVFSSAKIKKFAIFPTPRPNNSWKITSEFFVNKRIKMAIESEKLSGLLFEKASVV